MFNYKRLTFIFLFLSLILLSTDSQIEKQSRKSLLSFFDIVVEEGSQVTDTAPSSFIDTVESSRIGIYNFLGREGTNLSNKAASNKGIVSILLTIASYITLAFKFITSYVITFYPFIIFILYMFFSSRFFKRDEFGLD